jgi:hypothetical protein
MQHTKVDCLTNPKASPASKEEEPMKKIHNINNLQALRRAMRNNTKFKTKNDFKDTILSSDPVARSCKRTHHEGELH